MHVEPISKSSIPAVNVTQATRFHSDYRQTCLINVLAGNSPNGGWDAARHQLPIMEEEWKELKQGILEGDACAIRDGAADLLFTLIGFAHRAGIDLLADFSAVVQSNLTKIDRNAVDALRTMDKYRQMGVDTVYREVVADDRSYWITLTAGEDEQVDVKGKRYPPGKWLKSVHFEDVNFQELPDGCALSEEAADRYNPSGTYAPTMAAANDAHMDVPVEATAADKYVSASACFPLRQAVDNLRSLIHTEPSVGAAMETFLARTALVELSACKCDGYVTQEPLEPLNASSAAVTGAQRFLTMLLQPANYQPTLHPHCFAAVRSLDAVSDRSFASVVRLTHSSDRATLLESLKLIGRGFATDEGYLQRWHAQLTAAWKESFVSCQQARLIASQVLAEMFSIEPDILRRITHP